MTSATINDERWRVLVPPDAVVLNLANGNVAAVVRQLHAMRRPTGVALLGGRRLAGFARRHGVVVEKEYIAVPSLQCPIAITLIAPESLRWFARSVLTVPSGTTRLHGLTWIAIRAVQWRPRLLRRIPVGDRIVVGVRS